MEEQTATLLAALKKQASHNVDQRLALFNSLKSAIKHNRVPEACHQDMFECIRIAITTTTSAALVATGFSTLSHFIKRLQLQRETHVLVHQSATLCAVLTDRLHDAREAHRSAAMLILCDLHRICPHDVEAVVHAAMGGSHARAKEAAMNWIVRMNKNEATPFKSYVPQLVANLEDADPGVRDVAKRAVVELFQSAPEHAKANLKKQLVANNVRKTIASYITTSLDELALAMSTGPDADYAREEQYEPPPQPVRPLPSSRVKTLQPDTGFADSLAAEQPPPQEVVVMDPIHIYTLRELEDMFRDMAPPFEGRETEQNWIGRDKNTTKLRRLLKGNAPTEFHVAFVAGVKTLLDGILKVANTLRTTMSTNGCLLVQELAKTLGAAIDPWVEILLQCFIKMCAATKNIAAQNGNATVDAILSNVSYNSRILQHVQFASQDKNVQPRSHSASWVKTLIRKHKSQIEHSGGLETFEKVLKKGLTDANPKVREAYRSTYWTFALVWPQRAEAIFNTLEKREKNGLERDPNNPNAGLSSSQASAPSMTKSIGPGAARSALKEKIAEQRRAKLAAAKHGIPERPSSAAASYASPAKPASKPSTSRNPSSTSTNNRPPSAMSGDSTKSALKSSTGTGSLMSGTVRRPIRRPEISRPKTADPYAVRSGAKTPAMTPERTPAPTTAKKSAAPKSSSRPRAPTRESTGGSPVRSKSRVGQASTSTTQRKSFGGTSRQSSPARNASPARSPARHSTPAASPSKDEDLTMVRPFIRSQSQHDPATIPFRQRNGMEKRPSLESSAIEDDDNFTMINIPSLTRPAAQSVTRTPPKSSSPGRIPVASPRASGLRGNLMASPRIKSPERSARNDAQDSVEVYEDPVDEVAAIAAQQADIAKQVLGELPVNERSNERRRSDDSDADQLSRSHKHVATESETKDPEMLKNRQLLASGIKKIDARTVEVHMFRRMQDVIKANLEVWGPNDEVFGKLLVSCLEYLETPPESLKVAPLKAGNLKVQALATIRAMLALYRVETAKYQPRVLVSLLQTKSQHENTSHIALDLEATADEIVKFTPQTTDCLNAVLALIEQLPPSSENPNAIRTTTFALHVLSSLVAISGPKNINLSSDQTQRLGSLAVRCLDDRDADVRKADIEFCVKLHERIVGPASAAAAGGVANADAERFWKAVAGAREQHLNLLTYYLAKQGGRRG